MLPDNTHLSTGLPGLDRVFMGLRPGDNIVWQVDSVSDYAQFVKPYRDWAIAQGKRLIYFRFAKHEALVPEGPSVEIHQLHPEEGFEPFITQIHDVIQRVGQDAFYVFDALSELTLEQYSDRMLANFYMVTCPHLFALRTIAYYALLKNYHSFHASSPIAETTQVLVDVYRHRDKVYVHPRKVKYRYSPTMHMLHVWEGADFRPVTESNEISDVLTTASWSGLNFGAERPGGWTRTFIAADETLRAFQRGETDCAKVAEAFQRCLRIAVTRDEPVLRLAEKYLTLADVLEIKKRMLSSGLIGGKAVGMLVARAILKHADPRWQELLEPHDSFYVGSEVFYTFLVHNHCWRLRQKQKDPKHFLEGAEEARQRMLMGAFPPDIEERFASMLDYFGLSPIIVRSSSLLEDNYGNAFAGKYESVFCANQGPRHIRLQDLMQAVRVIYASSMSEEALAYRAERGVLGKDEQMALLVQRVSGGQHGSLFFPQAAGVGLSFNPYVWNSDIDPQAGMLRLVFGLGTRAVERTDDDYTRIVALNAPTRRPETGFKEVWQVAQRKVDALNLQTNSLESLEFIDLAAQCRDLPMEQFAIRDARFEGRGAPLTLPSPQGGEGRVRGGGGPQVLTFDVLLGETSFAANMRDMLRILREAYGCPVEIEFTLNFMPGGSYKINLLQCRPLLIKGVAAPPLPSLSPLGRGQGEGPPLPDVRGENVVLRSHGPVIGLSRLIAIDRIVYVKPSLYGELPTSDRYAVANVVGRVCHAQDGARRRRIMLLGPGRWGTSTPALGVPVSFREIRPVSAVCEIVAMHEHLVPDISLGTHFFSDFIESDILYAALCPWHKDYCLDEAYFEQSPNQLAWLAPDEEKWAKVVRVIDPSDALRGKVLMLGADTVGQKLLCYLEGCNSGDTIPIQPT